MGTINNPPPNSTGNTLNQGQNVQPNNNLSSGDPNSLGQALVNFLKSGATAPPTPGNVNTTQQGTADTLKNSGVSSTGNSVPPTSTPRLIPVDTVKTTLTAAFASNPWLKPSSAAIFLKVELALAFVMSKMKLADVASSVKLMKAKQQSVEANAKNIIDQAQLEFVKAICQAVVQFASAAIAVGMTVGSSTSGIRSQKAVGREAEALRSNPDVKTTSHNKAELKEWKSTPEYKNYKTAQKDFAKKPTPENENARNVALDKALKLDNAPKDYDHTGVSAWSQKVDDHKTAQDNYDRNPTKENAKIRDDLKNEAEKMKPGFKQIQEYREKQGWDVKPGDRKIDDKANQKNDNTLVVEKKGTENKDVKDDKTVHQKDKKETENKDNKDQSIEFGKDPKTTPESKTVKNTSMTDEKLQKEQATQKTEYEVMSNSNSREARSAKDAKMQAETQMYQAAGQVNQSLTSAITGIIGATFDLVIAHEKEEAVFIQANIDQLTQLMDSFVQSRKNTEQDISGIFSMITNYLQTMGQIASFTQ